MEEKKSNLLRNLVVGLFLLMLGFGMGSFFQSLYGAKALKGSENGTYSTKDNLEMEAIEEKLLLLNTEIENYYLEDVDYTDLEEGIYKGMLSGLGDPYSEYYTGEEYKQIMESTSGAYCGIGATLSQNQEDGSCTVVNTFAGSPAAEGGLLEGDIIYKVEDIEVTGMDLSRIVSYVKGEEGTKVKLTILRDGKEQEVTLERRTIEISTVTYEMKENQIGYIRLSEFDEVSTSQFKAALEDLESQGMKGLVVDLRNNPGGMLTVVVEILDMFLPEGTVVYTEDKYGKRQDYTASANVVTEVPMTVLVNGYSASASEIFAGAIKDYGRGTLVGTTTYGKGIVQRIMNLQDGSAIKLTVAGYFTPKGNNIHGKGVEPDVEIELTEENTAPDESGNARDPQLEKALELLQ